MRNVLPWHTQAVINKMNPNFTWSEDGLWHSPYLEIGSQILRWIGVNFYNRNLCGDKSQLHVAPRTRMSWFEKVWWQVSGVVCRLEFQDVKDYRVVAIIGRFTRSCFYLFDIKFGSSKQQRLSEVKFRGVWFFRLYKWSGSMKQDSNKLTSPDVDSFRKK